MHAFLLAGGFATRLWPLTERRPKPLLPLAGKPMLTHLVEKIPADIPITVSTNAAFADAFHQWIRTLNRPVTLIIEDTRKDDHKLGALGALSQWITTKNIDDDILVLTGDNYLGFSLTDFLRASRGNPLLAAHDIHDLAKASSFGTVILKEKNIIETTGKIQSETINDQQNFTKEPHEVAAFEEKPRHPKTTLVSTGCSILPKTTLPILTEYAAHHPDNVGGIFEELLRRGATVDCFTFDEAWMDIGSFQTYLDAHRFLVGGKILRDPTATVTANTAFTGSISLGSGSTITTSQLHDCMVFDNCQINDCILRDCIIDDNCVLKGVDLRGKMIRAGTTLVLE